jgi:hypothetical protein
MIHYALRCGGGHEFDGWFKSSLSFEAQADQGLLDCPVCADQRISRALMAPRLSHGASPPPAAAASATAGPAEAATQAPDAPARDVTVLPDQIRAVLQRLRSEVERRCDYVGDRFAGEARRIHAGIAPERPIYGEASPDEAEALAEEGIDIGRLPWIPRADS